MRYLAGIFLILICVPGMAETADWYDDYYPYRIAIRLDKPYSGSVVIDLNVRKLLAGLQLSNIDVNDTYTFAFEKAVLVDPATNTQVGSFKLVPQGQELVVDGVFNRSMNMAASAWRGYRPGESEMVSITDGGDSFTCLIVSQSKLTNTRLIQNIKVTPGGFYLLSYRLYHDMKNGSMGVNLYNPGKRRFAYLPGSYVKYLMPERQWTKCWKLLLPDIPEPQLQITTAFEGKAGVADISLRKVAWKLIADLPEQQSNLLLYCIDRAGHKLTSPDANHVLDDLDGLQLATAVGFQPQLHDINPDGVRVTGKYFTAWTVPSVFPLKQETILQSMPAGEGTYKLTMCRGEQKTLLIAVNTGTPLAKFYPIPTSTLPVSTRYERVANVPVYDGPFYDGVQEGKLVENRYDALMWLNDTLTPPSKNGVHLIAVTVTADSWSWAGSYQDFIILTVQTQTPDFETLKLPVEVTVLPMSLKPMHHFGTSFGGNHTKRRYVKTSRSLWKDSTTPAEFHGLDNDDNESVEKLQKKYYHRMLRYNLMPAMLASHTLISYELKKQGIRKPPKFINWDFSDFDSYLEEFVIQYDVPYFWIYGTNGHVMPFFRTLDGVNYTCADPEQRKNMKNRVQLSEEEFFELVGEYFNAIGKHLNEKGLLDRAFFHIDESDPRTYEFIYRYKQALKNYQYASRIKMNHTLYKTAGYTWRLPNGELVLDSVVDMPQPDNDEYINLLEPEYNSRMRSKDKLQWVYYVESDHFNLLNAGLSTTITPMKLRHFGASGWLNWASFIWSFPYGKTNTVGPKFVSGQVVNPWLNPFYHHGPGVLSFFYPPDPRGVSAQPTDKMIPSYRLTLMRDGIQMRALMDVLTKGQDDAGKKLVVNKDKLQQAENELKRLWADNPVQWYISYSAYRKAGKLLYQAMEN